MSTLVFLEHHEGELQKGSLGVLAKAASLGDAAGVIAGSGVGDLASQAAGAAKVWVADDPALEAPLPQPRVDVLAKVVEQGGYDTVLFAASVLAADIASGLAARLDAGLNWDLVDLVQENGRLVGKRPALGDSVMVDVGWKGSPAIGLVRSGTFEPAAGGGTPEVVQAPVELEDFSASATMLEQAHEEQQGPSIEDADIIVAGGRGLGGPENFALVEELARALGGAVAATRAVVDAGWYPYSTQVGQTGKNVAPKLYIACGISGAIQHKVGMQGSNVIVAINKDGNAPIFEFSDLGVVGDLHQVVPKLTELVRAKKGVVGSVPANYPPPWRAEDALALPTDSDPIEVGLLVVGAGPAGLACAIRLGQLCEEDPETAARLGDVPVAVLEKGKGPGSHLLSGAVLNPRGLQRLFKGRRQLDELPLFGLVGHESVYYLTPKRAMRIPTPPTMRNHGNYVASLSQLGRFLAQEAEEGGATILPETPAEKLIVTDGRVRGVRTADRGRGRNGEELQNFEPGGDILARITVLAEGTQGHLTGAAIERFGLQGDNPQVWALGVKEVWRVAKPLDRVIHTLGWPLRSRGKYREFGGSFVYPMGDDMVTIGMVVGLDYRDAELSVHDLLQELKTHKKIRKILAGGERLEWGAKTIPEGGFLSLPKRLHAPGLLLTGDGVGLVNVPALKGIHYAIESGRLAAEAAWQAIQPGEAVGRRGALQRYDDSLRDSFVWKDLKRVRNMRPAFAKGFWLGSALAGGAYASFGKMPPKDQSLERDADVDLITTDRARFYPVADGKLTFDKLSSVFASGNKTRDDQPSHIRIETRVPRDVAQMWSRLCPAHVYEVGEEDAGKVVVHVTPSNCVQCGAITAKGGRLTPPEGGSGPEYTRT